MYGTTRYFIQEDATSGRRQKCLHRYLAEFDFRYNNRSKLGVEDAERAERSLKGIVGKRLTYRGTDIQGN